MVIRPATSVRVSRDIWTLGLYELWWRRTRYAVENGHVEIHRGIFSRTEMNVPADKVVGVKTKLSPLLGGSRVIVDTGMGNTTEALFLTRQQALAFGQAVRDAKTEVDQRSHTAVQPTS